MSKFVRPSKNFVNLGGLYHFAPFKKSMPGWAYFEDGSMFIVTGDYAHHANLEARMQIAAQLVSHPGVRLHAQARRNEDTGSSRFLMVSKAGKEFPKKEMIVSARSASDGERIIPTAKPFLLFSFQLDSTGRRMPLVRFQKKDEKIMYNAPVIKEALRTFRGTLIDGTLQPNVRLSNGLSLRGMPGVIAKAAPTSESVPIERREPKSHFVPAPKREPTSSVRAERPVHRVMSDMASKELELQAKERELALREELLQWKQKTFGLAQQLAKGSFGENRRQRRLRTMSEYPGRNDHSFDSQFSEDKTRPRTRPRYSNEDSNSFESRYSKDDTPPRMTPTYHDENSRSSITRNLMDKPTAAHMLDYKARDDERASPHRADFPSSASTRTTRYAPPAMEVPAPTPPDPFDEEKPSTHEDTVHKSTSDTFASSILGTDTSAPPELDGLRTLIDELEKMDKRAKPITRRRRRLR